MTAKSFFETVDVGVDYFTVTGTTQKSRQRVWNFGMRIAEQERHRGNERRLWNWKQYEGFNCGAVQTGVRDDSSICRVAGGLAREHYREAFDVCTNCSRIDAQVTVRPNVEPQRWIAREFNRALAWSSTLDRPPAVDLHWSNNGTATAYFNKRVSDQFGRIYDKGLQSALPVLAGCVRYEVEYKNEMALHQMKSLVRSDSPHRTICANLANFFAVRRCAPRWNPEGTQTLVLHRPPGDRERQLEWIRRSVSPTVARLIASGDMVEVLKCLGLSEFALRRVVKTVQAKSVQRKTGG